MRATLHTKYRAVIVAFIILAVAVAILAVWPDPRQAPNGADADGIIGTATYRCEDEKSVLATYKAGSVELELSDLRRVTLPQAASASGARYAAPDGSFVFWNKEDTAFIQEHNTLTFTDCVAESEPG